jgi:hypothetical protein
VRFSVDLSGARGPFSVDAELLYQPIGFRWAANLKTYDAVEPRRFTGYYDSMALSSATALARVVGTTPR